MEYIVRTDHLQKDYKGFRALSGLTMHVPQGSIYGLVGQNGAGKTTLLRTICGLQEPSGGTYELFGIQNTSPDISDARQKIGAVIETPAIYAHMTAKENIVHQCILAGVDPARIAEVVLRLVGLEQSGNKKAGKFSLGMKQRLAIGIAIVNSPSLLILDEPMNGLDPLGVMDIRNLIIHLNQREGVTIILSSHILDELGKVATHYGFIDKGSMCREMEASELPDGNAENIFFEMIGGERHE